MTPTILYLWAGLLVIWGIGLAVWLAWIIRERRALRLLKEDRRRDAQRREAGR